ncbi:MAG TPA: 4Fe-4S binding protein [Geobacteraceae bacterium]
MTYGLLSFGQELARACCCESAIVDASPIDEDQGQLLVANRNCLAQRGGCFACIDHCPKEAISIRLGEGILVDPERCDGCGVCVEFCPVEPKVITMKPLESA